jgi:hypothetical protein
LGVIRGRRASGLATGSWNFTTRASCGLSVVELHHATSWWVPAGVSDAIRLRRNVFGRGTPPHHADAQAEFTWNSRARNVVCRRATYFFFMDRRRRMERFFMAFLGALAALAFIDLRRMAILMMSLFTGLVFGCDVCGCEMTETERQKTIVYVEFQG